MAGNMSSSFPNLARGFAFLLFCAALAGCQQGGGGGRGGGNQAGTNRARFYFNVDLQGVRGALTMEVEVVNTAGVVWGPGTTPDITAVISTGGYTIYTAGELRSPAAYYTFTGENNFADFTEPATSQRFRVEWIETPQGMRMVVNPFGPGPVEYDCMLTLVEAL
jgi:hypothetical protein